ncbi:MAG: hypothetical protein LN561_01915 [Rickettsia endosymbiont of Labidopullus appendiculatus]|nr:hypothetical protein [Rickettsia endosymbiont of Labidopullus appendiculatus]
MSKQGNESKPDSLANLNTAFDQIAELLKAAEKELKDIPQLKGTEKLQGEKSEKILQEFQQEFDKVRKEIKKDVEDRYAAQKRAEHEKTPIGRAEKFAKEQLKKVEKIFEAPINAIKNNKILNAVANVIKCSCKAIVTIVKSSLNNAIAVGKVAESVVNLGSAIKEAAMGKGIQASMSK